jgi:hypothetical protein
MSVPATIIREVVGAACAGDCGTLAELVITLLVAIDRNFDFKAAMAVPSPGIMPCLPADIKSSLARLVRHSPRLRPLFRNVRAYAHTLLEADKKVLDTCIMDILCSSQAPHLHSSLPVEPATLCLTASARRHADRQLRRPQGP